MKGHWKHLAMCAPILIPVAACVLMMGVTMATMGMFASRHGGD